MRSSALSAASCESLEEIGPEQRNSANENEDKRTRLTLKGGKGNHQTAASSSEERRLDFIVPLNLFSFLFFSFFFF